MKINNHIVLDFNKTKQVDTQTIQCDMNSRFVRVSLRHNNSPIDLSDVRVCIMAVKPDGKEIFNDCTVIDAQNGIAEFEITKQMGIVVGEVECQIKLFGKEKLLSSNIFNLSVNKSLYPDSQDSKDQLNTLVNALGEVQDIDNRFAQTNAQLSSDKKELSNKIQEVASIGTTIEVLQSTTERYIQEKIDDGTIANLTIEDDSITFNKLKNDLKEMLSSYSLYQSVYDLGTWSGTTSSNGGIWDNPNRTVGVKDGYSGNGAYAMITLNVEKFANNTVRQSFVVNIDDGMLDAIDELRIRCNWVLTDGSTQNSVQKNIVIEDLGDNTYQYYFDLECPSNIKEIKSYLSIYNTKVVDKDYRAKIVDARLKVIEGKSLNDIILDDFSGRIKELERQSFETIIFENSATSSEQKTVDVSDTKYHYLKVNFMTDRTIRVYGFNNDNEELRLSVVNCKTGVSTNIIANVGIYKINVPKWCAKIKFATIRSNSTECDVRLLSTNDNLMDFYQFPITTSLLNNVNHINDINGYMCMGYYDGKLFARKGFEIKYSENDGFDDFPNLYATMPTSSMTQCIILENGNVLLFGTDGEVYLSIDKIEWVNVLSMKNVDTALPPNSYFGVSHYKNIVLACEYRGSKTPPSGYKVYLSKDFGQTWTTCFDLEQFKGIVGENCHLHSAKYDKYSSAIWVTSGDSYPAQQVWYSLDFGKNWYQSTEITSVQFTEIIPMKNCVLFTSDSRLVSVFRWNRPFSGLNAGEQIELECAKIFKEQWGTSNNTEVPIGSTPFVTDDGLIAYFGYAISGDSVDGNTGDQLKYCNIIATNGFEFSECFKKETTGGIRGIYGKEDRVVATTTSNSTHGFVLGTIG